MIGFPMFWETTLPGCVIAIAVLALGKFSRRPEPMGVARAAPGE
jgi:hypothetical protein